MLAGRSDSFRHPLTLMSELGVGFFFSLLFFFFLSFFALFILNATSTFTFLRVQPDFKRLSWRIVWKWPMLSPYFNCFRICLLLTASLSLLLPNNYKHFCFSPLSTQCNQNKTITLPFSVPSMFLISKYGKPVLQNAWNQCLSSVNVRLQKMSVCFEFTKFSAIITKGLDRTLRHVELSKSCIRAL